MKFQKNMVYNTEIYATATETLNPSSEVVTPKPGWL